MKVTIRKFNSDDIGNKLQWINDPKNNTFLHYDLPLEYDNTLKWYQGIKDRRDRYDAVICVNDEAVGLIGLLSIDYSAKNAEYYIVMGDDKFKGKGIAFEASKLILEFAFNNLELNKVYLFTEVKNIPAQKLFEKVGFIREGLHMNDAMNQGELVDRYSYMITKKQHFNTSENNRIYPIMIQRLNENLNSNKFFMLRDDLLPYSFGGNKLRKCEYFFNDIIKGSYDCVITYGSSSSNHVRVIANKAKQLGIQCFIISPEENYKETFNSSIAKLLDVQVIKAPVNQIRETIDTTMNALKEKGRKPYFIQGGGHGNLGTQAYVDVYNLILENEIETNVKYDYIFFASGTGTTHAGLECGKIINNSNKEIVGISVARKNPYGKNVVLASIKDYMQENGIEDLSESTVNFVDNYIFDGYGSKNKEITKEIKNVFIKEGIPLDSTYTGKAYFGMKDYIVKNAIKNKNILFIHTGGTPLFFDSIKELEND